MPKSSSSWKHPKTLERAWRSISAHLVLQSSTSRLSPPRDCPALMAFRSAGRHTQASLQSKSEQNICTVPARGSCGEGLCPLSLQKSRWRPEWEGRGLCRWQEGTNQRTALSHHTKEEMLSWASCIWPVVWTMHSLELLWWACFGDVCRLSVPKLGWGAASGPS